MHGSLCVKNGVVYVGRHARTAEVRTFDFDGRRLGAGFTFRGADGASASGIAVDEDRRVWVADTTGGCVRSFTVFGRELEGLGGGGTQDRPGCLDRVVDVAASESGDEAFLLVASSGTRRHAVQAFRPEGPWLRSLRPRGDPEGVFEDVVGVAVAGRLAFVCESRPGRVQVFRDGEHHYALQLPASRGSESELRAVAPLSDGRLVAAVGGAPSALLLLDAGGRLLRTLADHGSEHAQVFEPSDVAVEEGAEDRHTRVAVIDRDGDRVQVFTLEGACYGAFGE